MDLWPVLTGLFHSKKERDVGMTEFSPIWYTIEEMKHAKPLCMYDKEQDA